MLVSEDPVIQTWVFLHWWQHDFNCSYPLPHSVFLTTAGGLVYGADHNGFIRRKQRGWISCSFCGLTNCWMLSETVRCCWELLDAVGNCWMLLETVGCCRKQMDAVWKLLDAVGNRWMLLETVGCCWELFDAVGNCWMLSETVGCCWNLTVVGETLCRKNGKHQ